MARRVNQYLQEPIASITYDHEQVTATTTWKVWKAPFAGKIVAANYLNITGLATHADNNFKGQLKNGSTVMATLFDTDADDGAALTADTYSAGTLATSTDLVFAAGDVLTFVATEEGTATLPAGRLEFTAVRT